jgi:translocation protein SEC63
MSSNEQTYDAEAQFFPFFIVTVSALVTLPLSFSLLRSPTDSSNVAKAGRLESTSRPNHADIIDGQRAKQKRKDLRIKRIVAALLGWALIGYMIYLMVVTARNTPTVWNPYDILKVSLSATEKQINSRYRKLSTTMHPDKRRPNAALNETLEQVNNEWVEIVKAYKALTDEDIRNNYIQYGHPDGKQSTSFGIALPQFLVAEGSGKYVLIGYGILLGIGLPWLVGKWWYGMQKMTKERILVSSAGNIFRQFKDRMEPSDVLGAVSTATEYAEILHGVKADAGLGKVEQKLATIDSASAFISSQDKKVLAEIEDPVCRKTLALLWSYLTRTDLDDRTLEAEKYELPPTAMQINDAFFQMCLAYGFTSPVISSFQLGQSLVQAVPPTKEQGAPLLQLPHFTAEIAKKIEKSVVTDKTPLTIQKFMSLPVDKRQAAAQEAGLPLDNLKSAEDLARRLPFLRVEKAFFKVPGEKYIITSSLVHFVVKARFLPPGTPEKSIPALSETDLLDIDPAEGDIAAQKVEPERHSIPLAHAPYYTRDHAPRWHLFLADNRQGKIAVPPFTFKTFDKQPFDDEGKPTFNVVTLKMQFAAPPQPGEFRFRMHLFCDSYIGFDQSQDVVLDVEDASKAVEVDEEDDISEPEEGGISIILRSISFVSILTLLQIPLPDKWLRSRVNQQRTRHSRERSRRRRKRSRATTTVILMRMSTMRAIRTQIPTPRRRKRR